MEALAEKGRGFESRRIAWKICLEQESRHAFLKDLFVNRLSELPQNDNDLVRNICFGVVRWKRLLDYNLDLQATRGIPDKKLRMLLRIGAYQILFLTGVPVFAAVNTTVEITKQEFGKSEAGFVNAVLKAIGRNGMCKNPEYSLEAKAINTSHPTWLLEHWGNAMMEAQLDAALIRNNEEAPLWIRINSRKKTDGLVQEKFAHQGIVLETDFSEDSTFATTSPPRFFRIRSGANQALRSSSFSEGEFAFQDPVAYWIGILLDWHPQLTLLDACSAPGGKAALILETAHAIGENVFGARIICADISWNRLKRIHDARERLGHRELLPVCADLNAPPYRILFDRILIDAPCSNLGVLRRRPEARWNLTADKISALAKKQLRLLEQAARVLAPTGRMVYAVCSSEVEETMQVVESFLKRHPEFSLVPALGLPETIIKHQCLWLYPGESDWDGFFAAALVRT